VPRYFLFGVLGAVWFLGILSGCVSQNTGHYGNFIAKGQGAGQVELAKASALQLATLYLPAKTRLVLLQETPDVFGENLVLALREAGFAVQEMNAHAKKAHKSSDFPQVINDAVNPDAPLELELAYVLGSTGEAGLYHLTLYLEHRALTRPYRIEDGRFEAVGVWAYQRN